MTREEEWKNRRKGLITASELNEVMSLSGKITEENISYVRHKRFQRVHGFNFPISGRALDLGHEQEPYAVAWWRANRLNLPVIYAMECENIPFWKADWGNFGASPDCFAEDESYLVEIKCLVGNTNAEFFADDRTSYNEKRSAVLKEHGNQLAGQFLSNPKVEKIYLLKYIYQRDDVDEDVDSPLAPWRGIVFEFCRAEFALEEIRNRIILFDLFIDSDNDAKSFKGSRNGAFSLDMVTDEDGKIISASLVSPLM